jgi:predicted transcriptional regulator
MLLTLENDVLGMILQSRNPVAIRYLGSKTGLSDRSVRRQLRALEMMGIICRSQTSGLWTVEISTSWRMVLINSCDLARKRVRLKFEAAGRLLQHALDNAAIEMFTENLTDFSTLDYVLSRCLSIEQNMIS